MSKKKELFARARAEGQSIEEAGKTAGLAPKSGYTHGLSRTPDVQRRIRELQSEAVEETLLTVRQLFDTITKQAFFDPTIFGDVRSLEDMKEKVPEEIRRMLVAGWDWDKQGRFRIKLVDKDRAIDRLARHLEFYNDTQTINIGDFSSRLAAARAALGVRD